MNGIYIIKGINTHINSSQITSEYQTQIQHLIQLCFRKEIKINEFLRSCDTYLLINNDVILALVQVEIETSRRFWLQHVCVHPNYQRQGYMTKLLKLVVDTLKFRHPKCHQLKLDVNKHLHGAYKLYRKCGFKVKHQRQTSTIMSQRI